MAKPRITIVGLGLIGNAMGLRLMQGQRDFEVVGHDKDNNAAGTAKKLGAVDKTDWNLINACDGADLIILALPVLAIRQTLEVLAGELKSGAVIMDTASIKGSVITWADETLPEDVHFVGTNPIVSAEESGGAAARADLFEKATWAICPVPATHERAVKMASDLAERLGATPLFLDPVEHDSMVAAVEHLPAFVSMALLSSAVSLPTWRETRKLAGGQFESSTRLVSKDPRVFSDAVLANSEHLLRQIDSFVENLEGWRQLVASGDEEALHAAFERALELRSRWLRDRQTGTWDEGEPAMPERRNVLLDMLGMGRLSSRRGKSDQGKR
jgi:prephenate dehydrogenase